MFSATEQALNSSWMGVRSTIATTVGSPGQHPGSNWPPCEAEVFSFLASIFSLQMLFDAATLHEQARPLHSVSGNISLLFHLHLGSLATKGGCQGTVCFGRLVLVADPVVPGREGRLSREGLSKQRKRSLCIAALQWPLGLVGPWGFAKRIQAV